MGRVFLEHLGGIRLFNCAQCQTNLPGIVRYGGRTADDMLRTQLLSVSRIGINDGTSITERDYTWQI